MGSTIAPSALGRVLQTPELVIIILEHLDELSLVRSQGVDSLFRNLVQGTRVLRQKTGLIDRTSIITNMITTSNDDKYPNLTWNPLLDWFVTRAFLFDGCTDGPINQSHDFVVFNVLPHALRAARNPASSIHQISITNKPVNRVQFFLVPRKFREEITARTITPRAKNHIKIQGVSIRDVFAE
jgi:hypothetical protein